MTNSERAIYFLSLKSCSIKKLKSTFRFYGEKQFALGNGGGGEREGLATNALPPLPLTYGPVK